MNRGKPKLALTSETAIGDLSDRTPPYWNILEYCRHLGIQKAADQPIYWVARIRRKDGDYTQTRLGIAIDESGWVRTARPLFSWLKRGSRHRASRRWLPSPIQWVSPEPCTMTRKQMASRLEMP